MGSIECNYLFFRNFEWIVWERIKSRFHFIGSVNFFVKEVLRNGIIREF